MNVDSLKFRRYLCFREEAAGFDEIKPVNIVIGRNNSGKSTLLDLLDTMCANKIEPKECELLCDGYLDSPSLQARFRKEVSGGNFPGNHWDSVGRYLVDQRCSWRLGRDGTILDVDLGELPAKLANLNSRAKNEIRSHVSKILSNAQHQLAGRVLLRLLSDRDIQPEAEDESLALNSNGQGATNVIRRLLLSTSAAYPRELVQIDLLEALNQIFEGDASFSEIQIQHHDVDDAGFKGKYEVYLGEEHKGLVPLSRTGSGLKTILLVLLNLLIIPRIKGQAKASYCFAFEEPENNLHPALLRRLFSFLAKQAVSTDCPVFITTHSSTALDVFGVSGDAQIIQVQHDGKQASSKRINAHFDRISVVSDLGASPSDLLQANGILWVEGPSDRVYLNRWIELFSEGELIEGRDYQCAFFAGALLGRSEWVEPDKESNKLANLLRINSNVVLVCDGDRSAPTGPGSRIKGRVSRVKREVEKISGSIIWITKAREIENYLTASILSKSLGADVKRSPEEYEAFFPRGGAASKRDSYIERVLKRRSFDKVELALKSSPHMSIDDVSSRYDLETSINKIVTAIRSWAA